MLHSVTADPFKLALYKLMGKLEPSRRSVAQVTTTTEDWLWFQLSMVRARCSCTVFDIGPMKLGRRSGGRWSAGSGRGLVGIWTTPL